MPQCIAGLCIWTVRQHHQYVALGAQVSVISCFRMAIDIDGRTVGGDTVIKKFTFPTIALRSSPNRPSISTKLAKQLWVPGTP
jgi:hypothetical protein